MKRLSKQSQATIKRIQDRVDGVSKIAPLFKKVSNLLDELGIPHEYKEVTHTKDTLHTWNKLVVKKGEIEYKGSYLKVKDLELLTSDFSYRRNPYPYIVKLKEIINEELEKQNKTDLAR